MNVNGVSAFSNATTETQSSQTNKTDSEKDLFMKLLVAQLKNQDPLDPQDGSEFVAQLAQFNSLDQLVEIRQLLEQLTSGVSAASKSTDAARSESVSNSAANIIQQGEDVIRQGGEVIQKGESVINNILKVL